jgi:hypothetical protein
MVERAIEGEAGVEIEPFRDYRGVPSSARGAGCPNTVSASAPRLTPAKPLNRSASCAACS